MNAIPQTNGTEHDWAACFAEAHKLRKSVESLLITLELHRPLDLHCENEYSKVAAIKILVCAKFGVHSSCMTSPRRNEAMAWPRQIAMFLAREHTRLCLADIGSLFGGRDHGTVLYAVQRVTNRMNTESDVQRTIDQIVTDLRAGK